MVSVEDVSKMKNVKRSQSPRFVKKEIQKSFAIAMSKMTVSHPCSKHVSSSTRSPNVFELERSSSDGEIELVATKSNNWNLKSPIERADSHNVSFS